MVMKVTTMMSMVVAMTLVVWNMLSTRLPAWPPPLLFPVFLVSRCPTCVWSFLWVLAMVLAMGAMLLVASARVGVRLVGVLVRLKPMLLVMMVWLVVPVW